jgi:hypothetical protein
MSFSDARLNSLISLPTSNSAGKVNEQLIVEPVVLVSPTLWVRTVVFHICPGIYKNIRLIDTNPNLKQNSDNWHLVVNEISN